MKNEKRNQTIYFALENVNNNYGGPIRSVLALAGLCKSKGFDTIILQANVKPRVQKNSFAKNYDVTTTWTFIANLFQIRKKNALVIFNNQWTPMVQLLGLALILFNIRFIWYVRGSLEINNFKKYLVWHLCQKYIINRSQYVLVSSQMGKEKALKVVGLSERNIIIIPNILDVSIKSKFETAQATEYHKKTKKTKSIKLFYLGRINFKKKIHNIIENLDMNKFTLDVELTVAGYLNDRKYATFIAEIAKTKNVKLTIVSNITENKKAQLFEESDIFVSMSDSENFGITIFEALWQGLPVMINSEIDYWPNSRFREIDALEPKNLTKVLLRRLKKMEYQSKTDRKHHFQKKWLNTQRKSKEEFLTLLELLS